MNIPTPASSKLDSEIRKILLVNKKRVPLVKDDIAIHMVDISSASIDLQFYIKKLVEDAFEVGHAKAKKNLSTKEYKEFTKNKEQYLSTLLKEL